MNVLGKDEEIRIEGKELREGGRKEGVKKGGISVQTSYTFLI